MQKTSNDQRRTELMELEKAFWTAMQRRDGKTAANLTDETALVVGPQGIGEIPRAALGGMIESQEWDLEKFELDTNKAHFKLVDDNVAIVAYEVDERLVVDGKREQLTAYDTTVWVRKLGKWVCVLHTETIAGDPFGRDRTKKPAVRA